MFFATLGVVASSIERLAIEVRHLQRTEVLEAEETARPERGHVGDAAMLEPGADRKPHRLVCMVRSYVDAIAGECACTERDISHSRSNASIADATITPMLPCRLTGVVDYRLPYSRTDDEEHEPHGWLIHSQRAARPHPGRRQPRRRL